MNQQYPPGTQEKYNSFSSKNPITEKGKESEYPEGVGGGKGEPPVPPSMNEDIDTKNKTTELKQLINNNITETNLLIKNVYDSTKKNIAEGFHDGNIIDQIKNQMANIAIGMELFLKGVFVDGPAGIFKGMNLFFKNSADMLSWSGEYFFSQILCGIQFIDNFGPCFFWYILDICVIIVKAILGIFIDVDSWVNYFKLSETFKYPTDTHKCYHCKRVSVAGLNKRAHYVKYTFDNNLLALFSEGGKDIMDGIKIMSQ
jgi:hypothetical protein